MDAATLRKGFLRSVLIALEVERITFVILIALGFLLTISFLAFAPQYFKSSVSILPPQQPGAPSAAMAQLGALAGVVGIAGSVRSPESMYVALLKGRRIQNELIDSFELKKHYGVESYLDARKILNDQVSVTSDKKSGFIIIEVEGRDAVLAAKMATAYVDILRSVASEIAVTEAQQRRIFFEKQVSKTTALLSQAESDFKKAQRSSGFVVAQALADSALRAGAQLRAQITANELKLQVISRFATVDSPEYQRASAELVALKAALAKFEAGGGSSGDGGTVAQDEALRAYRTLKTQEALLEVYVRQLEMARSDEAREGPLLQEVEKAEIAERPSWPRRWVIVSAGFGLSVVLAAIVAVGKFTVYQRSRPAAREDIARAWF